VVGLVAGYVGGWLETALMRAVDVLFSFTETLIALAAVAVLGPSLTNAMIAVGISSIPFYARITYGAVLVEKNKEYFKAAEAVGAQHLRLLFRHILPNILSPSLWWQRWGFRLPCCPPRPSPFWDWVPNPPRRNGARCWPLAAIISNGLPGLRHFRDWRSPSPSSASTSSATP
jgi:hypothetical protein